MYFFYFLLLVLGLLSYIFCFNTVKKKEKQGGKKISNFNHVFVCFLSSYGTLNPSVTAQHFFISWQRSVKTVTQRSWDFPMNLSTWKVPVKVCQFHTYVSFSFAKWQNKHYLKKNKQVSLLWSQRETSPLHSWFFSVYIFQYPWIHFLVWNLQIDDNNDHSASTLEWNCFFSDHPVNQPVINPVQLSFCFQALGVIPSGLFTLLVS